MTTRHLHRQFFAALATAALLVLAVSLGLFSGGFPATPDAAAATTPKKKTAKPTTVTIADYAKGAQLSAQGRTVAIAVQTGSGAELRVGTGVKTPTRAVGAGPLPAWAQPHVGTDAAGTVVITYPRCSTDAVRSCDLYVWTAKAKKAIRLTAISDPKRGETEGVLDRGNLALVREKAAILSTLDSVAVGREPYRTDIYYKPMGGALKRVTASGGRKIALRGNWIADVRDTTPAGSDDHECGQTTIGLLSLTGTRRDVRLANCGDTGRQFSGPAFSGTALLFGEVQTTGQGVAFRYDPTTQVTTKASIRRHLEHWAPVNAGTGYALGTTADDGICGEEPDAEEDVDENGDPIVATTPVAAPACKLTRITGMTMANPTTPKKR
jgi:hypothetical protein